MKISLLYENSMPYCTVKVVMSAINALFSDFLIRLEDC